MRLAFETDLFKLSERFQSRTIFCKMKSKQSHSKQAAKFSRRDLQPQKIFVERLPDTKSVYGLERELAAFFTEFGNVIDAKVLRNGKLKRCRSALCLCYFRQRGKCPGSFEQEAQIQVS